MTTPRAWIFVLFATALIWAAAAQDAAPEDKAPAQPVPFSHKHHAGTLKLQCRMCHPSPDPGESMTIAPPATCMQCHSTVKTGSPHIQRVAEAAKSGKQLPWARVYTIPGYVFFSHRAHLEKQSTCQDCHGPVAEREKLYRETNLTMGGCMDCHRAKKASVDCAYCHEPK